MAALKPIPAISLPRSPSAAVLLGSLCVIGFWLSPALVARRACARESATDLETRVKAAFLYKFSGYVEWPAAAFDSLGAPVVFGVMDDDAIADQLERMVDERAPGARPMRLVRLRPSSPMPALHILYIGNSQGDRLGSLIRLVRGRPVLVVTSTEDALEQGSMINLKLADGRVRFDVGLAAAQRSGLSLSARLLSVAQSVDMRKP